MIVEVVAVELNISDDGALLACSIDSPQIGSRHAADGLNLYGWVLGRESVPVAVEVVHQGAVARQVPVCIQRRDVALSYPDRPEAEWSGFRASLTISGISPVELGVRVVLSDEGRVPMGVIRLRPCSEEYRDRGDALVSVIIPCYNQARFLPDAIESVLAQTHRYCEIVVIDDGSTDDTSAIAARYAGVRCIKQDNRGLSAARNAGLRESKGEFLVFLDADDRLVPEALERGLRAFRAHPDCAFVAGHHRLVRADGSLLAELPPHRIGREHYAELLRRNFIAMHGAVMYKRDVFDSVGHFNTSLRACEDYDLYLRIAWQYPIHCYPEVVAEYRQHDSNLTHDGRLMLESALAVLRSQWARIQGNARYEDAYYAGLRFWQSYYAARPTDEKDEAPVLTISSVTLGEISDVLWGRNLEVPQPHGVVHGNMVEIIGWVLGRRAPVVAVEVIEEGRGGHRIEPNIERQDVAACYPDVADGATSGFHGWVEVVGFGDIRLSVQAVLRDGGRASIACIEGWRSRSMAPEREKGDLTAKPPPVHAAVNTRIALPPRPILVAGWFSFEHGHATAGDLLARDLVCSWLDVAGHKYEVAFVPPFMGDIDWRRADPTRYSHVIFVCGPFGDGELESRFIQHFAGCRLIGIDLSMLVPLDVWNPFDLLIERDSSIRASADIVFGSCQPLVPVVGVCLVEPYEGAIDYVANNAINRLIASREMAVVNIDTRLDMNSVGLRSAAEVESLLARMDVVVTTRLHGMVMALKNGVPVIAIDPEAGGRKIRRQAETIGWPMIFNADALSEQSLQKAFDYCLTDAARTKARECGEHAKRMVQAMRDAFLASLMRSPNGVPTTDSAITS